MRARAFSTIAGERLALGFAASVGLLAGVGCASEQRSELCSLESAGGWQPPAGHLPLVIIDTGGATLSADHRTRARITFVEAAERCAGTSEGSVWYWGSSSLAWPKKSFGFTVPQRPLFGLPEGEGWVLHAAYDDKSLLRNSFAYAVSRAAGRYSPRTQPVELYFSGGVGAPPEYAGIYILTERLGGDDSRIALGDTTVGRAGAFVVRRDRPRPGDAVVSTPSGETLVIEQPRAPTDAQHQAISQAVTDFEAALFSRQFADPARGYQRWIDVGSFVDHHLVNEVCKNADAGKWSVFFHRPAGGLLHAGPVWDFDAALRNDVGVVDPSGWQYREFSAQHSPYWPRLFQDAAFRQAYAARYRALRRGPWETSRLLALLDTQATELASAVARNFSRWPVLAERIGHNPEALGSWDEEIRHLRNWLTLRLLWLDGQLAEVASSEQRVAWLHITSGTRIETADTDSAGGASELELHVDARCGARLTSDGATMFEVLGHPSDPRQLEPGSSRDDRGRTVWKIPMAVAAASWLLQPSRPDPDCLVAEATVWRVSMGPRTPRSSLGSSPAVRRRAEPPTWPSSSVLTPRSLPTGRIVSRAATEPCRVWTVRDDAHVRRFTRGLRIAFEVQRDATVAVRAGWFTDGEDASCPNPRRATTAVGFLRQARSERDVVEVWRTGLRQWRGELPREPRLDGRDRRGMEVWVSSADDVSWVWGRWSGDDVPEPSTVFPLPLEPRYDGSVLKIWVTGAGAPSTAIDRLDLR